MDYQYKELVERAKEGDKTSMEGLIGNLTPLIYSAIRLNGRGWDREDLYQEACIILIKSVMDYDDGKGVPFLSYIKSRMYYGIFNLTRGMRHHVSLDQPAGEGVKNTLGDLIEDPCQGIEERMVLKEENTALSRALNSLSPKQREVIRLHYFQGMKLNKIAEKRGVHYKGILHLKKRALEVLAREMNSFRENMSF